MCKKTIEKCRHEIKENLGRCRGFHLGMSCGYAQTENSYTFTASCYADSLGKVLKLANHHNYTIELVRGSTFLITINTYKIQHKKEFLFLRLKRSLHCILN